MYILMSFVDYSFYSWIAFWTVTSTWLQIGDMCLCLQLTACVHGSAAMMYPMHWQHVYIPVLPQHLLDYCWWVCWLSPRLQTCCVTWGILSTQLNIRIKTQTVHTHQVQYSISSECTKVYTWFFKFGPHFIIFFDSLCVYTNPQHAYL